MAIEQIRHKIIASVWQAVAQSEVNISAIPQDQQEKLVGKITDNVMVTVNELLDESGGSTAEDESVDEHGEQVLWEGRPFLSLMEYYILTSDRLKIRYGMLAGKLKTMN